MRIRIINIFENIIQIKNNTYVFIYINFSRDM